MTKDSRFGIIIRSIIVITFILSVYFKLKSYSDFIAFIGSITQFAENVNLIFGNIIISAELFVILALIVEKEREDIIDFTIILLVVFVIFNIYLIYINNVKNCFCFGAYLEMTPVESIFKNIVLIALLAKLKKVKSISFLSLRKIIILTAIIVVIMVNITEPVDYFVAGIAQIEVAQLTKDKNYLLVDARNEDKFIKGHIPNAINIPFNMLGQNKIYDDKMMALINDNIKKIFIVYCDNTMCGLANRLVRYIKNRNNDIDIAVLRGGIEEWLRYNQSL